MATYCVVFKINKNPCHLLDDEKGLTLCGTIPGLETRMEDVSVGDDGLLYNASNGRGWPENIQDFCKRCLKIAKVDQEKTVKNYHNKYG